ncbi:MAG: hypothetical protein PHD88_02695 [Firmicutes bacterium]|nr:hypothetical protein [Bacillota bacterium]MDD4263066.1 hypothetical protein [Bacillota bacterium]MDD4693300.1 hypothetical protein [Bacillota bacterium]
MAVNITSVFAIGTPIHLGILESDIVIPITITVNPDHIKNKNHQPAVIFLENNFDGAPIYLKTSDGEIVNFTDPVIAPVPARSSSFQLFLSCDNDAPAGEYSFSIRTYVMNINNQYPAWGSTQEIEYEFQILSGLTLKEISLWTPPVTGEPWESNIVSRHTLRVTSNDDWQFSLQGIQICEGLHAVLFEKEPQVLTTHRNVQVSDTLTTIFDAPLTIGRTNNEAIFTLVLYIEDFTVVPAGELDLEIYVEVETLPESILNIKI